MGRTFFVVLTILVLFAAIPLIYPEILILGFFIIGPLGFALLLLPSALAYFAVVVGVRFLLYRLGPTIAWTSGILVAATIAILVPVYENKDVRAAVDRLTAEDHALSRPLGRVRTLAYLNRKYPGRSGEPNDCDEICQRLLYNGTVEAVLKGPAPSKPDEPLPTMLTRYRIENGTRCAAVQIPEAVAWSWEKVPQGRRTLLVSERIKTRIAAGECLVREEGGISEADVVVIDAHLGRGDGQKQSTGDGILDVARISLHGGMESGSKELFRRTAVQSQWLMTPLMYGALFGGYGMVLKRGFATRKPTVGAFEVGKVFADDFKLDVGLPSAVDRAKIRAMLAAAIADKQRAKSDPAFDLDQLILKQIAFEGPSGPGDVNLIKSMLGDDRVIGFFYLAGAIRRLGPESAALANPIIDRLLASDPVADDAVLRAMQFAIVALPPGAMRPAMEKLKQLAADKARRVKAARALSRLADGGSDNVPLLTELLREGWNANRERDGWNAEDVAIGALIGLCLLGEQARAAAPELITLLNETEMKGAFLGSRGQLGARTLRRMGASDLIERDLKIPAPMQKTFDLRTQIPRGDPPERVCGY